MIELLFCLSHIWFHLGKGMGKGGLSLVGVSKGTGKGPIYFLFAVAGALARDVLFFSHN